MLSFDYIHIPPIQEVTVTGGLASWGKKNGRKGLILETVITMNSVLAVMGVIVAIATFIGACVALYKYITDAHDRAQRWDKQEKEIKSLQAEQCMLTYCMMATLDGLNQLGANGPVTEARAKLDKFMNEKAHGVDND